MCYLVAKDINKRGCVALRTKHGGDLVNFKHRIIEKVGTDSIQLVTISRPSAYGEYEPYRFVDSEVDFENAVLSMVS